MKVLFIHCVYGQPGGEDSVVREEIRLLRDNGIEVDLLQFDNTKNKLRDLVMLPFNLFSYSKTRKACRRSGADIAHVHNTHFAGSAAVFVALKNAGLPFVSTLHNYRLLCPSAILYNDGGLFLDSVKKKFPWKAIRKKVYRNSALLTAWLATATAISRMAGVHRMPDRYIVLTDFAKNIFVRSSAAIPGNKLVVKPNFTSSVETTAHEDENFFLFIGRLTEDKGINVLLDAFAGTPYRLKIAGDGPLKGMVEKTCRASSNISYLGQLDPRQVQQQLSGATALVFPSNWYEGMPMTIIEAFAAGCPVLASDLGAMKSMVEPGFNGLHFVAGSAAGLRSALDKWSALGTDQRKIYTENARSTYRKYYTPEENARQLITIYKDTLRQL